MTQATQNIPASLTADEVYDLAVKYLEPEQPAGWRLEVQRDGILRRGDWWDVLVLPSRRDAKSYDYFGRLAEAEVNLHDNEGVNVSLVPVLVPDGD